MQYMSIHLKLPQNDNYLSRRVRAENKIPQPETFIEAIRSYAKNKLMPDNLSTSII